MYIILDVVSLPNSKKSNIMLLNNLTKELCNH